MLHVHAQSLQRGLFVFLIPPCVRESGQSTCYVCAQAWIIPTPRRESVQCVYLFSRFFEEKKKLRGASRCISSPLARLYFRVIGTAGAAVAWGYVFRNSGARRLVKTELVALGVRCNGWCRGVDVAILSWVFLCIGGSWWFLGSELAGKEVMELLDLAMGIWVWWSSWFFDVGWMHFLRWEIIWVDWKDILESIGLPIKWLLVDFNADFLLICRYCVRYL